MDKLPTYKLNRGIGRPVEFKGLQAPYFGRFILVFTGAMGVMAVLHVAGVHALIAAFLGLGLGGIGLARLYRLSNTYGQYGLMKRAARRQLPAALVSRSRKIFIQIYSDGTGGEFQ